jgi:hypothetical protein
MYGDIDRQAGNIIAQGSENTLNTAPRIAVYMTDISLDRLRLADSSFVGKIHARERDITDDGHYGYAQGKGYTVERLMPTPYNLSFKADIWSANTEQKLQIMEQILMLFNPSLEIQTTDNYVDWTSLSVVDLNDIIFSSRTIPVGTATPIDVTTLSLQTPIWISPPAKVKKLGVITNIIMNVFGNITDRDPDYLKGLGTDTFSGTIGMSELLYTTDISVCSYDILVSNKSISIINNTANATWAGLVEQYPDKFRPGLSKIRLTQPDHTDVVGYFSINPFNDRLLTISEWDIDTFPSNDVLPGPGRPENSWGTFDAIIDPIKSSPISKESRPIGLRYLIVDKIGGGVRDTFTTTSTIQVINTGVKFDTVSDYRIFVNRVEINSESFDRDGLLFIKAETAIPNGSLVNYELYVNEDGPDGWKNGGPLDPSVEESDFIADANDIIEWDGVKWHVIFSANESQNELLYLTNLFTLTQYKWNGQAWVKAVDGEYRRGSWRIEL